MKILHAALTLAAITPLPVTLNGTAVISGVANGILTPQPAGTLSTVATLAQVLQAGHPAPTRDSGVSPDSPGRRVDPNVTTSPYGGVGSIFADQGPIDGMGVMGTGTPIDRWHVLTAAHLLGVSPLDGQASVSPSAVSFILNFGSDLSQVIPVSTIAIHPDYHGDSSHDDLAVLTLAEPLPMDIPVYPLADPTWLSVTPLTSVGYGWSGDGLSGYYVAPDYQVKRAGMNLLEYAELDDEGGGNVELVAWDFEYEGDPGRYDVFGVPYAFPNQEETMLGGGDSGGPSFVRNPELPDDPQLYLAVVNGFSLWFPDRIDHDVPGEFGGASGGVWLNSNYQAWIASQGQGVPDRTSALAELSVATLVLGLVRRIRARV